MMTASLWCDEDVDGKMFAGGGEFAFQSAGISNAAFRVINETEEMRAPSSLSVALDVNAHLVGEVFPAEPRSGFLHHDGQTIVIEEIRGAGCAVAVSRGPFVRTDIVKMLTKKRMHQVLHVALVFDADRRSILSAQAELARHDVKPLAQLLGHRNGIRVSTSRSARLERRRRRRRVGDDWRSRHGNFLRC